MAMPIIKEDVGDVIQNVVQSFLAKGLDEEIRMMCDKNTWNGKKRTQQQSFLDGSNVNFSPCQ
eukprot:8713495-Ditylum_brightwellii.AAC.1